MAKLATSVTYKVGDRKPDLVMYVKNSSTKEAINLTGTTATKFYLRDIDGTTGFTNGLEADTDGVGNSGSTSGTLTKEWQADDLSTAGRYAAWFSYERGTGKVETTSSVEVNVKNPWQVMES